MESSLLKLYRTLVSGEGVEAILAVAARELGNPLLLLDLHGRVLEAAGLEQVSGSTFWEGVQENRHLPQESRSALLEDSHCRSLLESGEPVRLQPTWLPGSTANCRALLGRVRNSSAILGFLLMPEACRALPPEEETVFSELCGILGTELRGQESEEGRGYSAVITAMLEGKLRGDQLRQQLLAVGVTPRQIRYLMVICAADGSSMDMAVTRARVEELLHRCRCLDYQGQLLALVEPHQSTLLPLDQREQIKQYLIEHDLVCGSSNAFNNISLLPEALRQATTAIRIGRQLSGRGPIHYLWEYATYQMCDLLHGQCDLTALCNPLLLMIRRYDQKNHTSFQETLRIYIATGCNTVKAAKLLGIHRNTLDYRLDRIDTLFGVSTADPNLIYSFYQSFEILNYLEQN